MRERHTYEIDAYEPDTDGQDGQWRSVVVGDDTFSRDPAAIARGLLENWVIEHPHELHGGERLQIAHPRRRPPPPLAHPRLRVRVFRGAENDHDQQPVAVGYLGHDARDFPPPASAAPVEDSTDDGNRLRRLGASAARLTTDRRVRTGAAVLLAVTTGYLTHRTIRYRGARLTERGATRRRTGVKRLSASSRRGRRSRPRSRS